MESESVAPAEPIVPSTSDGTPPPSAEAVVADTAVAKQSLDEFAESSKPKYRSRNSRARAEDVPRIATLTRRLREAEEERDRYKNGTASTTEPAAPVTEPRPAKLAAAEPAKPAPVSQREEPRSQNLPPVKAAKDDPEPDASKYQDLTKWMGDHGKWAARDALRDLHAEQTRQDQQTRMQSEVTRIRTGFAKSWQAAKGRYPDFEAVATAQTRIPQESFINAWILEHDFGADVLYHLQKNPNEVDAMLASPPLKQAEALSLLTQRLSSSRPQAAHTGSAATNRTQPVVMPPNPVRTAPQRTSDDALPNPDNLSLDAFDEAYGSKGRRR